MAEFTPMMKQYFEIKNQHKDCILMYRLGDFYEMFFDDAIVASRELEITLTGRDCGQEQKAPMCGVPFHSVDSYVFKLINNGHKVAICEQTEDPSKTKGLVKREVIRIITPGTVLQSNMLDSSKNNYICSIYFFGNSIGVAFADISTGELKAMQIDSGNILNSLIDELAKYSPSEIIGNSEFTSNVEVIKQISLRFNTSIWSHSDDVFDFVLASEKIKENVSVKDSILKDKNLATVAAGSLIDYLEITQKLSISNINSVDFYERNEYMVLDISTRRNLELVETLRERNKKGTLLWVLDKTKTSMGAREIRKWLEEPLLNINDINKRLDSVEALKNDIVSRTNILENLDKVYDIERLLSKVVYGTANARDLISLKDSLENLPSIKSNLSKFSNISLLSDFEKNLDTLDDIYLLLDKAIVDEPPVSVREGGIIKNGYSSEVDEYRSMAIDGKKWLSELENNERELTGIKNLKIGFNKVFGYFIEVTKSNFSLVPDRYVRKQTLANCERYITSELKDMEDKILNSQEKIVELEYNLFVELRNYISSHTIRIQQTAKVIAKLDVIVSLALIAEENNYVKPVVSDNFVIDINNGRHPVVEHLSNGDFIPNDTYLDLEDNSVAVITGPNMAGKSTYMRQVALIVLMAQIGSFVPADCAKIGVVDRIFTRVGASDDLGMGQSTFMIEMTEVANILNNATNRSLLVLDEVGRGTSTYDGLSIAWAVTEYIADKNKIGARALFATHYHELTELEGKISGIKNYCISVKENGDDIIFLRKIIQGGADESYGVQVAKLAGVPYAVINRAKELLNELEDSNIIQRKPKMSKGKKVQEGQMDLFNYKAGELLEDIKKLDINDMTPVDAMNFLYRVKAKVDKI